MDVRVIIPLTSQEVELIMRPVRGQGGWQSLLRHLQQQLVQQSQLDLGVDDVRRIVRYQARYGTGGFQGRLTAVLDALRRLARALLP